MTLTTHIVVGAAAAKIFTTHPVEAFFLGAATHFVLDAIPHWDYPIASLSDEHAGTNEFEKKIRFNKMLFVDMGRVLLDVFLGAAIFASIIFLASHALNSVGMQNHVLGSDVALMLLGATGGVVPDFLQFLYGVWKNPLLKLHQQFHHFIHAQIKLDDRPLVGVPIQLAIVLIVGSILTKFLIQ